MKTEIPTTSMVALRWYPDYKGAGRSYKNTHPTPHSVLRATTGLNDYKWECETVNTSHIRAACIMPRGLPFAHLMNTPWSMCYKTKEYTMIIVSVQDCYSWIDLARGSGATHWMIGHAKTHIYHWEAPRLDQHRLKIRPNNTLLGMPHYRDELRADGKPFNKNKGRPVKDYNLEELLDDIREYAMNYTEIGKKHGLSRIRVMDIAKEHGIRHRAPHHGGITYG
jgi:hypothetical protein